MGEKSVCVRVDCNCPFLPNWLYYPRDIIGLHRIKAGDPRAKIGSLWNEICHCCGYYYSKTCKEANCIPAGKVVEVISDCSVCSYKDRCPFSELPDIFG